MDGELLTSPERLGDRRVVLLADREELSATHSWYSAGEPGPDPHVHHEHTDSFYVLRGELTFRVGPKLDPVKAGPGTWVSVPPNVVHAFSNESDGDAEFLNFHTPDGGFAAAMRSLREGGPGGFDSHDPPGDGGLPAAAATIARGFII